MNTIPIASRTNRSGPQRRCPPCPACGDDAMRQYGAKHHGVVHRYFYACQTCQHTDVWREIEGGEVKYWEKLRVPLTEPRYEQVRFSGAKQRVRKHSEKRLQPQQPAQPQDYSQIYALCCDGDDNEIRAYLKDEFGVGRAAVHVLKGVVAMAMQRSPLALDSAQ